MTMLFLTLALTLVLQMPRLGWDQMAPSAAEAEVYVYRLYIGTSVVGIVLNDAQCLDISGTSIFTCTAALPLLAPGRYRVQLTAANEGGESAKSSLFQFRVRRGKATADLTEEEEEDIP